MADGLSDERFALGVIHQTIASPFYQLWHEMSLACGWLPLSWGKYIVTVSDNCMAQEVIEILEYLKDDPVIYGIGWASVIGAIIAIVLVVAIFIFVFRQMAKMDKRMDDFRSNHRKK